MLADYAALRTAGRTVRLLIGPWGHGRGLYTRVGMRDAFAALELGDGTPPSGVRVFITGSRRWTELPGWPPPARDTAWYLHPAGGLSTHLASAGPPSRFRYDPANPTPSIAGTAVGLSAGPADNRRLEARPDVLTFTSDPQAADLEVIGPVRVRLHVQASRALIDLHARLCDVTQRGRSINVSDGIVRLTDATPDTAHPVEFALWPIAHTFRRGHRIRLQVSGGAHPRYGRNHGTAEPYATSTRLEASDRTVLHDAHHPSAVWLPVYR
jgi:putative CocE/NonD family hydrolase